LSIVIPTYNEYENLKVLLPLIKNYKVLLVDDGSTDKTLDLAKEYKNVRVIERGSKKGLVSAELLGMKEAGSDYCVVMDADLSHNPKYIDGMVNFAINNNLDLVIGSRYIKNGKSEDSFLRMVMSKFANLLFKLAFTNRIMDATSGFRVYSRKAVEFLSSKNIQNNYTGQIDIVNKLISNGYKVGEYPINFVKRRGGKSNLKVRDILDFVYFVLKFGNIWKYLIVGLTGVFVNEFILFLVHSYNIYLAEFLAIEISILSNAFFNEVWTFKSRYLSKSKMKILARMLKANSVFAVGFLVNYSFFFLFLFLGVEYLISNLIAIIIAFIFNYLMASLFIWGEKN